jgi:photosystem II stability/assembly factor-like uncharacterized protein
MRAFLDRAGVLTALLFAVLISSAPAAQAKEIPSPWKWTDYGPALRDVSCSSAGACTAVGQSGMVLRHTGGAPRSLAWSRLLIGDPQELAGVTCTHTFCLAVSNTRLKSATFVSTVYRSTDRGARWSRDEPLGPAGAIKTRSALGLACDHARAETCYAVGPAGGVWRSSDEGRSWHALDLPATPGSYRRVACPAKETCVAVGGESGTSAIIEGTKITNVALPAGAGGGFFGLACDTQTRCTATDGKGQFMSMSIPERKWGPAKLFPTKGYVSSLACPKENMCVGLSTEGVALRTTKLSSPSGEWHKRPLNTVNLKEISCAGTTCVAVGGAGSWFESSDEGSEFKPINEVAAFDAIQCSAALKPTCVAGGMSDIGVSRSAGELWSPALRSSLGLGIESVNCTTRSECLFLGKSLTLFTNNLEHFVHRHTAVPGPTGADELTCMTRDVCIGMGSGSVYTTLDGAQTLWNHNAFPGLPKAVACLPPGPDSFTCVATTGDFIYLGTMTVNAGVISWTWTPTDADPSEDLAAVGCSPGGWCTAAGKEGVVLTSARTNLMHWTERIIPAGVPISDRPLWTSVACPADGVCLAGGEHGTNAVIGSTTNNWTDFSYDKISGIEGKEPKVTAFGCASVDRCVGVGSTALVGVRKP